MAKKEKKDGKEFTKGLLTGIGAAIGIAALGIGGKLLYDKFKYILNYSKILNLINLINYLKTIFYIYYIS